MVSLMHQSFVVPETYKASDYNVAELLFLQFAKPC